MFQKTDGSLITASQLTRDGGEVLLGPDNSHVRVMCTKKHQAEQRCFLQIHTSQGMLEVTDDHRVIGHLHGANVIVNAHMMRPQILTGAGLQPVQRVDVDHKVSEVVEPVFENDAPVLVWSRAGRRFKYAELEHAFAVPGGLGEVYKFFNVKHDFFGDVRVPEAPSMACSRSADTILTPTDHRRLARARSSRWSQPSPVVIQAMAD